MAERFACARTSRDRSEPLLGTASTVSRWLLVEQSGAWGRDALPESGLGVELGTALADRARRAGVRPLLVRRANGTQGDPRTVFVASSVGRFVERFHFDDPDELLDLDLDPLRTHGSLGGEPVSGPLLLTCTNGKHDACCAEWGRPVAAAVAAAAGDNAWEVSHIGGDRFAANVLWLPDGVYYGRVEPDEAAVVAALAATGRVSLPHYRGRSIHTFAAQAAEVVLRRELAADLLDEVELASFERDGERARAEFVHHDERWEVRLVVRPEDEPQRLTCRSGALSTPARYEEVELERLSARP